MIRSDESVQIKIEYEDRDCNLGGGLLRRRIDDGAWSIVSILDEEIGCANWDDTGPIVFELDTTGIALDSNHLLRVRIEDACQARSASARGEFKIIDADS
ncbi:MAG: hypothetical protein M5R36_20615 [Deltaproteobacteria bacterium]|nr:hypothetical protein [Deltaproteobacteria bacterium]